MWILADSNPVRYISRPYLVYALIAVNLAVYALIAVNLAVVFVPFAGERFGFFPVQLFGGELPPGVPATPLVVRLFAHQFVHGDLVHLASNMLILWVFGDNIEDAMGRVRFFLFYLASGVAAAFAQAFLAGQPEVPMVGASGAIAGILGAYLILHPKARVLVLAWRLPVVAPASFAVGIWIGINVVMAVSGGAFGPAHVAWFAHIGGFLAGVVLVVPMRRAGVPLLQPPHVPPEQAFADLTWALRVGGWRAPASAAAPGAGDRLRRAMAALAKIAVFVLAAGLLALG